MENVKNLPTNNRANRYTALVGTKGVPAQPKWLLDWNSLEGFDISRKMALTSPFKGKNL